MEGYVEMVDEYPSRYTTLKMQKSEGYGVHIYRCTGTHTGVSIGSH